MGFSEILKGPPSTYFPNFVPEEIGENIDLVFAKSREVFSRGRRWKPLDTFISKVPFCKIIFAVGLLIAGASIIGGIIFHKYIIVALASALAIVSIAGLVVVVKSVAEKALLKAQLKATRQASLEVTQDNTKDYSTLQKQYKELTKKYSDLQGKCIALQDQLTKLQQRLIDLSCSLPSAPTIDPYPVTPSVPQGERLVTPGIPSPVTVNMPGGKAPHKNPLGLIRDGALALGGSTAAVASLASLISQLKSGKTPTLQNLDDVSQQLLALKKEIDDSKRFIQEMQKPPAGIGGAVPVGNNDWQARYRDLLAKYNYLLSEVGQLYNRHKQG